MVWPLHNRQAALNVWKSNFLLSLAVECAPAYTQSTSIRISRMAGSRGLMLLVLICMVPLAGDVTKTLSSLAVWPIWVDATTVNSTCLGNEPFVHSLLVDTSTFPSITFLKSLNLYVTFSTDNLNLYSQPMFSTDNFNSYSFIAFLYYLIDCSWIKRKMFANSFLDKYATDIRSVSILTSKHIFREHLFVKQIIVDFSQSIKEQFHCSSDSLLLLW